MTTDSDRRLAGHAVGALILMLDDAAKVLPVVKPLALRGCDKCRWIIEAVEAILEGGEESTIDSVARLLNDIPVEGFKRLTRFHAIGRQWLCDVMENVPDEFIQDVRDLITETAGNE